jgi:acyl-CoA synthetase (AMP-forming)/AMP-acid ligase II
VYPSDLEAVLEDCPEIREAAVVGRLHEQLGEVPVTCVVRARGSKLTPQRVLALFKNKLAVYKHPRDVIFLDALPRNWHGKIDRCRLHEVVATAAVQEPGTSAPDR